MYTVLGDCLSGVADRSDGDVLIKVIPVADALAEGPFGRGRMGREVFQFLMDLFVFDEGGRMYKEFGMEERIIVCCGRIFC